MDKMLKILDFIKHHINDWEEVLQKEPYYLKVSRDICFNRHLVMLKYNQIDSDFNNEIVRECRGLIFDEDTLEPVSIPFFKFGNYGESYCPTIDWKSAKILEKLDGSLIKVVRLSTNDYLISTNGTINAYNSPLQNDLVCPYETYGQLFDSIITKKQLNALEQNKTYMFELTSPYNRVVVPYTESRLSLIGIRDNISLKEEYIYDSCLKDLFPLPKKYEFKSLEDCITAAKELPYDDEGYVVLDNNFNRVKVKSLAYVNAHHLKSNDCLTVKRVLSIILENEVDEYLIYFPEHKNIFDEYNQKLYNIRNNYDNQWKEFQKELPNLPTRKDIALFLKNSNYDLSFIFAMLDKKVDNVQEYIHKLTLDSIIMRINSND